jgi:hypothetical protein
MNPSKANGAYEVLGPWAEVDPVPLRGISPRPADLKDKTIGLFANSKQAARPILTVVEEKLKERVPTAKFAWYTPQRKLPYSIVQTESENRGGFEDWLKGVDAVVAAIGD